MRTQSSAQLGKRVLLSILAVVFSSVAVAESASPEPGKFVRDLPTQLGEFSKGKTHQYEEAELGASAAYYYYKLEITATIYAYGPGRDPETGDDQIQKARDSTKRELQLFTEWGKVRHLGDDEVMFGAERHKLTFLRSWFSFESPGDKLLSYSYVTQLDDHLLKVRLTCPEQPKGMCSETGDRFVTALAEFLTE